MAVYLCCPFHREQFPTDGKPWSLEAAVSLSSDEDRVDSCRCQSLTDVGSANACYKSAQDEISKCKQVKHWNYEVEMQYTLKFHY